MNVEYGEPTAPIIGKRDLVVGIDVGGTGLKGAVIDLHGRRVAQEYRSTRRERGPEAVVESILAFASDLACSSYSHDGHTARVVALGVVVPGLVDEEEGVARTSSNLGWNNVPLRRMLQERVGLPAFVGHDVRAGGIAEGFLGAARGYTNYMFATLGTGVGAVIVLHGSPYLGVNGAAGEFGHIVIQQNGPLCACGAYGCIEAFASASAVARRYQDLTQVPEPVNARDVAERTIRGDEAAKKVWGDAIEALSLGIANYVTLLDPECVILGGGMADAGPTLFDPLNARLTQLVRFQPVPAVLPAQLGNDAGYLGAALKAWLAVGVPQAELNWRSVNT